jgi:GT2 family glycosyltransferase/tetratricopeptide (TPR) repeat protein
MPQREGVKASVIVVSFNTIEDTARCVDSVFRNTENFELIVVDNGSTDGSVGYLRELAARHKNVKLIENPDNRNFGPANNQGVELAEGERIVFLNSDTIVTAKWIEMLDICMRHDEKIAIVGPCGSNSAGRQMVGDIRNGRNFDEAALEWTRANAGKYQEAGLVFGWCMFVSREFLEGEEYAFDPQFVNAFEDNDLCMRARTKGLRIFIDFGTYIYHIGQRSFKASMKDKFYSDYLLNGRKNQELFYAKWAAAEKPKLIAVYRIANCEAYIAKSLEQTSKFADEIICLFARSKDRTKEIALSFPKVKFWEEWHEDAHPFDEQAERDWLLQAAIARGADWIISIDGDEVYEDKFVNMAPELIRPKNPQIMGYSYFWRTIWEEENGVEKYRADGIFGGFQNCRFFRVLPGMRIRENSNVYNHHCGSAPSIPPENVSWLNIRVKHLGYDTEAQRKRKYEFYRNADPRPVRADVGNEDYHHLIDKNVTVKNYREKNDISVMVVCKDEEELIGQMLTNIEPIADEIVIVDTGSTDHTIDEVIRFGRLFNRKVRIFEKKFDVDENGRLLNYSEAKNWAKMQCRGAWILNMDCDELFMQEDVHKLFNFIDEECDGFLFSVINYLSMPKSNKPQENEYSISETIRLYRNIPEIFYSGLVHESLEESIAARCRAHRGYVVQSPVALHHRGYLKTQDRVREKINRYEKINMRQFAISGEKDPRPLFNMALHYLNDGDTEKGIECYKKTLELDPAFWRSKQNLGFHHLNEAKKLLAGAMQDIPESYKKNNKINEILDMLNKFEFGMKKVG